MHSSRTNLRTPRLNHVGLAAIPLALGFGVMGTGCMPAKAPAKPALPIVGIYVSKKMDVPVYASPNGTTRALEEVAIRARVRGFLTERHFEEGAFVKKGDLLMVIEEDTYKVALASAKAKLAVAEAAVEKATASRAREMAAAQVALDQAQLGLAQIEEKRTRSLVARTAASREDLDKNEAERKKWEAQVEADKAQFDQSKSDYDVNILSARAQVDDAKAAVDNAKLDLGYCRMDAPIAGRIGEALVKVGNLVGPTSSQGTDASSLATIQQLDPMGVDIQVSSRYLDRASRLLPTGLAIRLTRPGLEGSQEHPYVGHCFFIDNTIDKTTSTFLVKAKIPNPQHTLLPGEYVKLSIVVDEIKGGIVVPEQAVNETQAGPVVYVVDKDNKVATQRVEASETYEGLRVITTGLDAGINVIVEGIQLVRPGMEVKTEPVVLTRPSRDPSKKKPAAEAPKAEPPLPAAKTDETGKTTPRAEEDPMPK